MICVDLGSMLRFGMNGNRRSDTVSMSTTRDQCMTAVTEPREKSVWIISTRREKTDTQNILVSSEYDDVRSFVLTAISPEHLLAEKVGALLVRSKARDIYDIWLLSSQGVLVDRKLIEKKLELYEIPLTTKNLDGALEKAKADWTRDLRPLLPQLVSGKDAVSQVEPVLRKLIR